MANFSRLVIVLVLMAVASLNTCGRTKILYEKDAANLGINVIPESESRWKSSVMQYPGRCVSKDRVWTANDFFMDEFGKPCVFNQDWIEKYGYYGGGQYKIENEEMVFTTGKKGFFFAFGPKPNEFSKPSLRFGATWGKCNKDVYRVVMEIEQDVEESNWEFETRSFFGNNRPMKKFKIKGKGAQLFEYDLDFVRRLNNSRGLCGFTFRCLTPGATIKIKRIKLAPSSANLYFRKTFFLKQKPVIAHATFLVSEAYDFYVNGEKVSSGSHIYPSGTVTTVNLLPYLKKGENIIAYSKEIVDWSGTRPEWLFEGVCVDCDGDITRLLGDKSWTCSLSAGKDWMNRGYNDQDWKVPRLSRRGIQRVTTNPLANGTLVYTGVDPCHMGVLTVSLKSKKYPVFEVNETAEYDVKIPVGIKDEYRPVLDVYKAGSSELVKRIKASKGETTGGLVCYLFKPDIKAVGPYRLEWLLVDKSGKKVEKCYGEFLVVGPVKQDEVALGDFEEEFNKRLKLVRHIDCTQPVADSNEFIDHAGMYNPAKLNKGKVVKADGMTYRETGIDRWDYFAYRLHLKEKGKPYLIEVVVPDNRDRYIYSGVVQQFPIGFCNNPQGGSRGWFAATGTAYTGVNNPLSFQKKKIRYIYYPGSQTAAVVVMSGFSGHPAAACEINVYKIEGGLPALKVPETKRMFGSHNERMSVMIQTTGMAEQPLMADQRARVNGHRNGWYHWYKAIERKIKLLRFQGRNMTVEGVFMYTRGDYPSQKHCHSVSNQELDPPLLAIKMYNKNRIKCMLGVEYMVSQQVGVSGIDKVSDRQMWQGMKGIHFVDRHGRQLVGQKRSGVNFLHPAMGGMLLDCVKEIYERYNNVGTVDGLFMVLGNWWAPGFVKGAYRDIQNTEVGYGDFTIELFEKETGIMLGVDKKSSSRFQQRYDKLMGELRPIWLRWRAEKTKEFLEKIVSCIHGAKDAWHLYLYPTLDVKKGSPFSDLTGTRRERDRFMEKRYRESGLPHSLYRGSNDITLISNLVSWGKCATPKENYLFAHGWNSNVGSKKIIKDSGAIYFQGNKALDEVDCPANAAAEWIWTQTDRGVFVPRGIEEYCMKEFVNAVSDCIPHVIFYSWLDCNMETAFGAQLRRFCKAFYVTPEVDFKFLPAENVKGIIAQYAEEQGKTYLRLVNNTPYLLKGTITTKGTPVYDLVYDKKMGSGFFSGTTYSVELLPNDIRVFTVEGIDHKIKCSFNMVDSDSAAIVELARYVINNNSCLKKVPGDMVAQLFKGLEAKDSFKLYKLLQDFEVAANIQQVRDEQVAMVGQNKLLEDLTKDRARIICASTSEYIDPKGQRWLPDQGYSGGKAYGNIGANLVDRGDVPIEGTDLDRVYQTEAFGGAVTYKIPVPNGEYKVFIHFAETYVKNKRPGCRQISLKVEEKMYPEKIDPFTLAGGWCKPYVVEMKNVLVCDEMIDVELLGTVGINGIEIERIK